MLENSKVLRKATKVWPGKSRHVVDSPVCILIGHSILLACIVHARRPLRLDELSEAAAAACVEDKSGIDKSQKLFKSKILKLCEPLIQVQKIGGTASNSVCTLTHSSVQKFLLKHPDILSSRSAPQRSRYLLTEEVMGNVCLRYLWQPTYRKLLTKTSDAYLDLNGTDLMEQHLLPYAAKYWDKHLDSVSGHRASGGCEDPESFCNRVMRFIQSSQFVTCLQAQSLLVEGTATSLPTEVQANTIYAGQFQFWLSANHTYLGPHIKRVFPQWFAGECHPLLAQDYQFLIGEWGELLDTITSSRGPFPGEIDRCLWKALGPNHFLRKAASRYESFMLSEGHEAGDPLPRRYYDAVNEAGDQMLILKLENL